MMGLETIDIAAMIIVGCVAALVHGISGLGFPLLLTAVVTLFMPMKLAVALSLWPTLVLNSLSIFSAGRGRWWGVVRRYAVLAGSSVMGSFAGMAMLIHLPQAWFQVLLAVMMLVLVGQQMRSGQADKALIPDSPLAAAGFGALAGFVGGATNAMSPVVLLYLLARKTPVEDIAPAANLCYATGKLCQLVTVYAVAPELLPLSSLPVVALTTALAVACLFLGLRVRRRIPAQRFRMLLLWIIAVLALFMGWRGVQGVLA